MNKIFVIGDTHFWHTKIMEYCNRPFDSVEDMNEKIVENWNSVVKPEDTVYHLGDVSFAGKDKTKELVSRLNGIKVLSMGNHDRRKTKSWFRDLGFSYVIEGTLLLLHPFPAGDFVLSHEPVNTAGTPYVNIHAHLHDRTVYPDHIDTRGSVNFCASVEMINYTPISLEEIVSKME